MISLCVCLLESLCTHCVGGKTPDPSMRTYADVMQENDLKQQEVNYVTDYRVVLTFTLNMLKRNDMYCIVMRKNCASQFLLFVFSLRCVVKWLR